MLPLHEVCTLFPAMESDQRDAMRDDIRRNGVQMPIWVYDGKIIDGRNRAEICDELGVDCPVQEYTGSEDDLVTFVLSLNMQRRHLSSSQRAGIAAEALSVQRRLRENEAKPGRPSKPAGEDKPSKPASRDEAIDELAAAVGSNRRYLKFADLLRQERPDLLKKVIAGDVSIRTLIDELGDDLKGGHEPEESKPASSQGSESSDEERADCFGHPVPEHMHEAWDGVKKFTELAAQAKALRTAIGELCESAAGAYIERAKQEVCASLKHVEAELKAMCPYVVCPHCEGATCNQCRGVGWIPKAVYDLLPEEVRQAWSEPVPTF